MRLIRKTQLALFCAASIALVAVCGAQKPQTGSGKKVKAMSYSKVAPLFAAHCMGCHNSKSHPESVNLSSYDALMKSGEHGPIVIAGHPEKSKLIMYVDGEKQPRMPFKKTPLTSANIALLKKWIAAGAKN